MKFLLLTEMKFFGFIQPCARFRPLTFTYPLFSFKILNDTNYGPSNLRVSTLTGARVNDMRGNGRVRKMWFGRERVGAER